MSFDSPNLNRRPPPRPPKTQYLLSKEAELRSNKQICACPSSIAYPKGKNPFGESSDDEEQNDVVSQPTNSLMLQIDSKVNFGANPFDDDVIDDDNDETKLLDSIAVPEVLQKICSPPDDEVCMDGSNENTKVLPMKSKVRLEESSPPPNPFDGFSDSDEEVGKITNVSVPQIPPKPLRKRPAPKPPVLRSTDGLSSERTISLSLHAVNEDSVSSLPTRSAISSSIESFHRLKGPAPPQPVGQKREIRAEGFVKYPKLRREIEETNAKLLQIDEEIAALNVKIGRSKDDAVKNKTYSKKLIKLMAKREEVYAKHHNLSNRLQEQVLEDRHADLEFELRNILAKQEHLRTEEERNRSEELLNLLMEIVAERDKLVEERGSPKNNLAPYRQSSPAPEIKTDGNHSDEGVLRSD